MTRDLTERIWAARSDGRHLAAQQHLVADHQRGDDARMFLGQFDRNRNLGEVLDPVAGEPDPLDQMWIVSCLNSSVVGSQASVLLMTAPWVKGEA